jgi:hypothetical protein
MRLVGDLFAYVWSGRDNNCNSYVLSGALKDDRHLVVDPGHVTTPALGEVTLPNRRIVAGAENDLAARAAGVS